MVSAIEQQLILAVLIVHVHGVKPGNILQILLNLVDLQLPNSSLKPSLGTSLAHDVFCAPMMNNYLQLTKVFFIMNHRSIGL